MAAKTSLLLANRQGEGKAGQFSMAGFDAYFGESAPTISILPKF
jgi:hypothetical protein